MGVFIFLKLKFKNMLVCKRISKFIWIFLISNLWIVVAQKPMDSSICLDERKANTFAQKMMADSAVFYYQQAIKFYKKSNQQTRAMNLYYPAYQAYALGVEHNDLQLSDFEDYIKNIEVEVLSSKNPKWLAQFYVAKMDMLFKKRMPIDSMVYYTEKLEKVEFEERNIYLLGGYAICAQRFFVAEDIKHAKQYIDKASKLVENNNYLNTSTYANLYYSAKGTISYALSDLETALTCILKCVSYTENDLYIDTFSLLADYNNLAACYSVLGEMDKEILYYNKTIDLIQEANFSKADLIATYQNLAICKHRQQKYNEAIQYGKEAILLAQEFNDRESEIIGLSDVMWMFYEKKQIDSAKYYANLFLLKKKAYSLNNGVELYYSVMTEISLDEELYLDALHFSNEGIKFLLQFYGNKGQLLAKIYRYKGISLAGLGRYHESLSCFQNALHAISVNFISKSYIDVPNLNEVSDKTALLAVIRNRIPILEEFAALYPDSLTLEDVYEQAKIGVKVLEEYQRNLSVVSKESAMGIESARTYSQAMDLAIKLYKRSGNKKYLNEAFLLSEKSKSSLLLEALHANDMYKGIPDSLLQREKRLTNLITQIEKSRFDATLRQDSPEIMSLNSLLFKYHRELDSLKNKLRTEYAQYYNHGTDIKLATLSDIQQQLDNESTLIEFFESKKNYYVFVIDKQHTQLHTIPLSDSLRMRMQAYQADLSNAKKVVEDPLLSYNTLIKESYELYQRLIQPILKDVKTKRLIIIPDGFLGYIPFEAFITQPYQPAQTVMEAKFDQLKYLLFDYTMSYNYSATLWWEQLGQANKPVSMSCLGMASTYQNRTIPASRSPREQILRKEMAELQGVAREVEYLERDWSGDYFVGMASTERAFKQYAPQHGILHLAMHGIVDKTYPEYSSLAFSEDNDTLEDNFLYAYEVKQLNLNAALVVLSACETGAGKYLHGEGVLSLGRGFMHAGVASILMTLWQLNDQTGSLLMPDFYENLRAKMFKDEAIRQAKIKYLNNMKGSAAHPALWACFIQVGDYRPVEERTNIYKWLAIACGGAACIGLAVWWRQRRNRLKIS